MLLGKLGEGVPMPQGWWDFAPGPSKLTQPPYHSQLPRSLNAPPLPGHLAKPLYSSYLSACGFSLGYRACFGATGRFEPGLTRLPED